MSAKFSMDDDATAVDAAPVAASKLRLPHFPPGREATEVKRWFKEAITAIKAHRYAHVLRLVTKDLAEMSDKEFSDNALVTQAVYDCLSSEGERRRLREELKGDADHCIAAMSALARSGVRDSDLSESLHREQLQSALKVQFRESTEPGTAKRLLERWERQSLRCAKDDRLDDAKLCKALKDALPFVLREPWRTHLIEAKRANPSKATEYECRPAVLASELDKFFKSRRDSETDLLGRTVLPASLRDDTGRGAAAGKVAAVQMPVDDATGTAVEEALVSALSSIPDAGVLEEDHLQIIDALAVRAAEVCRFCGWRGHNESNCYCKNNDDLSKIRDPDRKAAILKSRATGLPPPPPKPKPSASGVKPPTATLPPAQPRRGAPRVGDGSAQVVELSFGGDVREVPQGTAEEAEVQLATVAPVSIGRPCTRWG